MNFYECTAMAVTVLRLGGDYQIGMDHHFVRSYSFLFGIVGFVLVP